jgi:hypothetical protein
MRGEIFKLDAETLTIKVVLPNVIYSSVSTLEQIADPFLDIFSDRDGRTFKTTKKRLHILI